MTQSTLFNSQSSAQSLMKTQWFPHYSSSHVKSQDGLKWAAMKGYNLSYETVQLIHDIIGSIAHFTSQAADFTLGWAARPIANLGYEVVKTPLETLFPVNPVNGKRHLVIIPRSVEKFLGDWIFYPLATGALMDTSELIPGTKESMNHRVQTIMQRLSHANEPILNPAGATKFDYRVRTVASNTLNAFAVPAGGMVVYSQLIKELHAAFESGEIKESKITFADGSSLEVDLSDVTMDDALAALMGHEMTHAAARHSISTMVISVVASLTVWVGKTALMTYLMATDPEYRQLMSKPQDQRTAADYARLGRKQLQYDILNKIITWAADQALNLHRLLMTRNHEYEADTTGAYFANEAQFNPLGAIYLQELLGRKNGLDWIHKNFEFLFTHPWSGNRKRALMGAITEIAPDRLNGKVKNIKVADHSRYARGSQSKAYTFVRDRFAGA